MKFPVLEFSALALKDLLRIQPSPASPQEHQEAALEWLKRAHRQCGDDGVSYGYSLRGGWLPSYRETSGYIATTFFNLAQLRNDDDDKQRALSICRWLMSVQNADGSFANPKYGSEGIVFDTGQDLFGLVRAYEVTQEQAFLDAANRAGDWLVAVADEKGHWTRNEHFGVPHAYNSRSAWALLRLHSNSRNPKHHAIAKANLDWAVSEQKASGFFDNCSFKPGVDPYTHTIAYATRGLLESASITQDPTWLAAAVRCADSAIAHVRDDGFLPGQISVDGMRGAGYCCVTGNCQFAIAWIKLYASTSERRYKDAATKALDFVMRHHDVHTGNPNVRGAVKGSQPIWGRYAPMSYPNWATKFFIDAMLLREQFL